MYIYIYIRYSYIYIYIHIGYGIAFYGTVSWSFVDGFVRKVIIFGVDISSSIHNGNCKNSFSELGEEPNDDINDSIDGEQKKVSINF